mgnify:FL=1|tara:strand:+ start:156 stop:413 length:258 start_codon:yes stop_codon:yes gene_type:complete
MKRNKIDEITYVGGLIGWLLINPRKTIDARVSQANEAGWTVVNIIPGSNQNALFRLMRYVVLTLTLGIFTFGDGVIVIYEKDETQ